MVKWKIEVSLKDIYAGMALVVAIALSFVGTFLPPTGEIHDSMLYLIAQFLLLVATLMGVGYFYNKWSRKSDMLGRRVGERLMGVDQRGRAGNGGREMGTNADAFETETEREEEEEDD